MKKPLPTDPRTLAPPGKSICVVVDSIIVIDDGGGECVTSFSDDEAIALFLEWLDGKREQRAREQAEAFHQYQVKERRESLRIVRSGKTSPTALELANTDYRRENAPTTHP